MASLPFSFRNVDLPNHWNLHVASTNRCKVKSHDRECRLDTFLIRDWMRIGCDNPSPTLGLGLGLGPWACQGLAQCSSTELNPAVKSEKKTKATREILTKIIDRNSFVAEAASRLATWQVNRGVSGHEQSRHQQRRRTSGGEGELGDRAGALLRKEKRRRRRVGRQSRRIVDE
nr:hypothetical protein Iba_chr04bCG9440 [Ipomoea batatas]